MTDEQQLADAFWQMHGAVLKSDNRECPLSMSIEFLPA